MELINEIMKGMMDTADSEEEWGDETEEGLDRAMLSASLVHDTKFTSLAAAYRAQDLREETERLMVKCKYKRGKADDVQLTFKESYKDKYTCEEIPMGAGIIGKLLRRC